MKVECLSFTDGRSIPQQYAFAKRDSKRHTADSDNLNPHLRWEDAPAGTRSFALICHDPDVPQQFDDANQEGRTLAAAMPRRDFFHWLLVDIPADVTEIKEGEISKGTQPKSSNRSIGGARAGLNDYSSPDEPHFDYDGPCPPWNDERLHRYVFTVYALDCDTVGGLGERFTGAELRDAIVDHTLAQAQVVGTYTLNPVLAER